MPLTTDFETLSSALLYNIDAEGGIFAGICIDNRLIPSIALKLGDADAFFSGRHRRMWTATLALHSEGKVANQMTIPLRVAHTMDADDGEKLATYNADKAYLGVLVSNTPDQLKALDYADIVADLATYRKTLAIADSLRDGAARAIAGGKPAPEFIEQVQQQLLEVMPPPDDDTSAKALVDQFMLDWLDPKPVSVIATGGKMLDKALNGGFRAGQLVVLAADTGDGKTALACQLVRQTLAAGKRVLYYSLEEPNNDIMKRLILSRARVRMDNFESIKQNTNTEEYKRIMDAQDWFYNKPLSVRFGDGTAAGVALDVAREQARQPIDLVVFDHLQIAPNDSVSTRNDQLDEATRIFKRAALETGCVLLTLSQYNRNRSRETKRNRPPELSDLRDSGAIAQNADIVGMIHTRLDDQGKDHPDHARQLTLYLRKNRYGPRTDIGMEYDATIHSFKIN